MARIVVTGGAGFLGSHICETLVGRGDEVIAIDNLPSLLPVESSRAFSAELYPQLLRLGDSAPAWGRALRAFETAVATDHEGTAHVR